MKKIVLQKGKNAGSTVTLLNPAERGRKYAKELTTGADVYTGEKLTNTQLAFRGGYMKSRAEEAKIFRKKNPDYVRKLDTPRKGHFSLKK